MHLDLLEQQQQQQQKDLTWYCSTLVQPWSLQKTQQSKRPAPAASCLAMQARFPERQYRMVVSMSLGAPGPLTIEQLFFR
jgi:hypothetical protein